MNKLGEIKGPKVEIIHKVLMERDRQDELFPNDTYMTEVEWLPILGEEVGEVNRAVLEGDGDQLKKELVQVAATAIAWLEDISRNEAKVKEYAKLWDKKHKAVLALDQQLG